MLMARCLKVQVLLGEFDGISALVNCSLDVVQGLQSWGLCVTLRGAAPSVKTMGSVLPSPSPTSWATCEYHCCLCCSWAAPLLTLLPLLYCCAPLRMHKKPKSDISSPECHLGVFCDPCGVCQAEQRQRDGVVLCIVLEQWQAPVAYPCPVSRCPKSGLLSWWLFLCVLSMTPFPY